MQRSGLEQSATQRTRTARTGVVCLVGALAVAACGGDDGGVSLENAWSRASAPGQPSGAIYFDLTVDEDDRLLGASVPAEVARAAEVHEVVMVDTDDMEVAADDPEMSDEMEMSEGSHDMDDGEADVMRMQEIEGGLVLTAGETVSFEPGGHHVMLPGLVDPLEVGDEFELTLDFEVADDVTVTVEVAETAP